MTIRNILAELEPAKPIGHAQLYKYLRRFKIKPLGTVRMCPQQYPDDTPKIILAKLGLEHPANGTKRNPRNPRNGGKQ